MKRFIKIISLICVIALLAGCGLVSKVEEKETTKKSETIATVGGVDYNLERFNLYFYNAQDELLKASGFQETANIPDDFWTHEVDGKTILEMAKESALTSLINDAIANQKAASYGLELTADEKSAITNQMSALRQDKVSISQFDYIGISVEELERYYKEGFMIQHLIPELISREEIVIKDSDVNDKMKTDYVKAKHILIPTLDTQTNQPLSEKEVDEAKKKAEEILFALKGGADFDELMNAESQDPGLATAPDGYLFTTGEMVPEFEEAAFALKENEISGLVETSYGIHILKRVPFDAEGEQEKSVSESIKSQLAIPEFETLIKTWKAETEIVTNDKLIKGLKPTITNNKE